MAVRASGALPPSPLLSSTVLWQFRLVYFALVLLTQNAIAISKLSERKAAKQIWDRCRACRREIQSGCHGSCSAPHTLRFVLIGYLIVHTAHACEALQEALAASSSRTRAPHRRSGSLASAYQTTASARSTGNAPADQLYLRGFNRSSMRKLIRSCG